MAAPTTPVYQFLSQPPPPRSRQAPPQPSPPICAPPRRRSNTTITAWIASVQPGSPAPCTPPARRRPSVSRPCSRRPSVTSTRVPSASFLNLTPSTGQPHTPGLKTPSVDGYDLLIHAGYSSAFVRLPTPVTPAEPKPVMAVSPAPKKKLPRFRSLAALKIGRAQRSKSVGERSPRSPRSPKKATLAALHKRAAAARQHYMPQTAAVASDAALMQFLDGGSTRHNVERAMRERAVRGGGGAVRADGVVEGVSVAVRDDAGRYWESEEERLEYEHLLRERREAEDDAQWIEVFDPALEHTVSGASTSTADSELDAQYRVQPAEPDELALPGARTAKHLRRHAMLLDSFALPKSPKSPKAFAGRPRGRARTRPAPLTLMPPRSATKLAVNGPIGIAVGEARRAFLDESFEPAPVPAPKSAREPSRHAKGKASMWSFKLRK